MSPRAEFQARYTMTKPDLTHAAIASNEAFNTFCQHIIKELVSKAVPGDEKIFKNHLDRIAKVEGNISTAWGGVDIESYDHPDYKKNLVITGGTWLSFETHEEKEETIRLDEGDAVLLLKRQGSSEVDIIRLQKGIEIAIHPGEEHCLIALTDSVVFEYGKDPKGMDKDLIFLFDANSQFYLTN